MPNSNRKQTVYVSTGNPDTVNETAPGFNPGQLGQSYDLNDREYQFVQLDSGATAATPAGAPAANQLLYWKDRSVYLVTNDSRFGLRPGSGVGGGVAASFRNNVAGILRNAATPGNMIFLLQRGRGITVNEAGSGSGGELLVSDTSTTACQGLGVAINTAAPAQLLGVIVTATAASVCTADLDIVGIP